MEHERVFRLATGFLRILGPFLSGFLVLGFLLGLFEPGNPENRHVFVTLSPVFDVLHRLTDGLAWPVRVVLSPLSAMVPVRDWFPQTPVAPVLTALWQMGMAPFVGIFRELQAAPGTPPPIGYWLPGKADWSLLLAVFFWQQVEKWILLSLEPLRQFWKTRQRKEREQELSRSLRDVSERPDNTPVYKPPEQDVLYRQMVRTLQSEISTLQSEVDPLKQMVNLDRLTQLYNRAFFDERLKKEINRGRVQGRGHYLGLVMVDIDDFKQLNDQFGHTVGDRVLQQVADAIQRLKPAQGKAWACRYGGEEMAVILSDTSIQAAEAYAQQLCEDIHEIRLEESPRKHVSASVGLLVAHMAPSSPGASLTDKEFVSRADAQMYIAKRNGKNQMRMEVVI